MQDISDEALMAQFQAGDGHAFELLFEKYRGPLFNFIYRMVGGRREPAEDLLQEIFMKLARSKEFYEPRAKFATWLFTITRNHCLNHLRSRSYVQAQQTVSFDRTERADETPPADALPAPKPLWNSLERAELCRRLEQAIQKLTPVYREVFLLRAVQGCSHAETAQILGMNPAMVRLNYYRARLMLQTALRQLPGWEEVSNDLR